MPASITIDPVHTRNKWVIVDAIFLLGQRLSVSPTTNPLGLSRHSQNVWLYCLSSPPCKVQVVLPPCYITLPFLAVIHAHSQMITAIKNGFEGKRFPPVMTIPLPSSAHEIIKCCPNLEEVTCTDGRGSIMVGSLVKGNCNKVRVLKGILLLSRICSTVINICGA